VCCNNRIFHKTADLKLEVKGELILIAKIKIFVNFYFRILSKQIG